jgi:hypothetical protein
MADKDFACSSPTLAPQPVMGRSSFAQCLESRSLAFGLRRLMTPVGFWIAKTRIRAKKGTMFLMLPKYPLVDAWATLTAADETTEVAETSGFLKTSAATPTRRFLKSIWSINTLGGSLKLV